MLYSWDRLNKIGPIKNNRLSVQIDKFCSFVFPASCIVRLPSLGIGTKPFFRYLT
jgi:hypothetical protein